VRARDVVLVQHPVAGPVEVQESGAGLAHISAQRRQLRYGADGVAAARLALETLADPQQRRPGTIPSRGLLDRARRHAGDTLAPFGSAALQQRLEFLPANSAGAQQPVIEQAIAADHMRDRERERRVAAGKRLQVQIGLMGGGGPDRVDDDNPPGRPGQPVFMLMRRGSRRVRAPDHDARRIRGAARIKAIQRGPIQVLQRDVSRLVADRVGVDLTGAEPAQEPIREVVAKQRERAGVVGPEDCVSARALDYPGQALGDLRQRLIPGHGPEAAAALRPVPPERRQQPGPGIQQDPVVGRRALAAQPPAADRMITVAAYPADRAAAPGHLDAARVVAVPRAGREDAFVGHGRSPINGRAGAWHRGRPPGRDTRRPRQHPTAHSLMRHRGQRTKGRPPGTSPLSVRVLPEGEGDIPGFSSAVPDLHQGGNARALTLVLIKR
jgi:hypothetical protein